MHTDNVRIAVAMLLAVSALGACGNDDKVADGTRPAAAATTGADGDKSAYCKRERSIDNAFGKAITVLGDAASSDEIGPRW